MILSLGARILSAWKRQRFAEWANHAEKLQLKVFHELIKKGGNTSFGSDHALGAVNTYEDFFERVPVRDYEDFRVYIKRIMEGESNVLWPGKPMYFAKTSGTTSGAKYIPITCDSLPNHIDSARNALLMYLMKTGNTGFIDGKYMFISGSPELEHINGIPCGRLSGIVHHHVPVYLRNKRFPTFKTNCIGDWEKKLDAIIRETHTRKMSLISGIPPWLDMYFDRMLAFTGKKTIHEVFPDFSVMVHGGVNFKPYKDKLFRQIGRSIDTLETYPASEGFFAFQDEFPSEGLLLIPDSGIFFEFIPVDRVQEEKPLRLWLDQVETGVNYLLVISTNAGLWGYSTGDTVRFVSTRPYRLVVSGRLSQYTSAFGEHVIAEEAEYAIETAARKTGSLVREFTLAPLIDHPGGLPCHQWFVEFQTRPEKMDVFAQILDQSLQDRNPYYRDLVAGHVLQPAMLVEVPEGTFTGYMKSMGKLGGQNKVQHLSNDRKIADWISSHI